MGIDMDMNVDIDEDVDVHISLQDFSSEKGQMLPLVLRYFRY